MKIDIKIIKEIKFNEKIYTVDMNDNFIIAGGTSKNLYKIFYNEPTNENTKIECKHEKSIRSSFILDEYYGCASYDGTATIFYKDEYLDVIEGPETEIKSLAMSEDKKYIGLSTRGRTVWLCINNNNNIEVESILEDHQQDVKGVKFYKNRIYSYGYDNSIKIYILENENEDVEIIQNIEVKSTVWDILITDEYLVTAEESGSVSLYKKNNKDLYVLEKIEILSFYPIYSIAKLKDYIAVISNRNNILIVDYNLKIIGLLENEGEMEDINEINCYNDLLVSGGDDGRIIVYKIIL